MLQGLGGPGTLFSTLCALRLSKGRARYDRNLVKGTGCMPKGREPGLEIEVVLDAHVQGRVALEVLRVQVHLVYG